MSSSGSNTNTSRPLDEGIIPMDIHICGICRSEFDDIYKFMEHKKLCKATLSGLSGRTEKEYTATSSKAYGGCPKETNSTVDSEDPPHSHDNVLSDSQTDSSLNNYVYEYANVSEPTVPLIEPSHVKNNDLVSLSNTSCQPQATSSHCSSHGLQLLWHHLKSSDSFGDQSRLGSKHDASNSVSVLNFANPERKSSSNPDKSIQSHEISSLRNKEVLPSIDLYRHVREPANSNLLGSVETKSLNTIDNSTPCPEDLEVGQISAAMLGKLSKKFSSNFCFNETFSSLDKNSVEDESTSSLCNPVLAASAHGTTKGNAKYLSLYNRLDKSHVTYRNINAASAPVSEKRNLNLKERRERLPGVSDELLTSSPCTNKQNTAVKGIRNVNKGRSYPQNSDDSTLSSSRISPWSDSTSLSPPPLTSYKAIFTSPSSAGHRLAPDIHSLKKDIESKQHVPLPKDLSIMKENKKEVIADAESVVVRDTNKTSYRDISKLIQNSYSQSVSGQESDSVSAKQNDASSQNENIRSNAASMNNMKSNLAENMGIKNNMVSLELIASSETGATPREASDISQTMGNNSYLSFSSSSGWNMDGIDPESGMPSSGHHSLPNEMIISGETLMLTQQPGEMKEKAVVTVIQDSCNNLIMMYPGEEQGEIFITDSQASTTVRSITPFHDGSGKNVQGAHLLFQPGAGQELTQTQESLLSTNSQQQYQSAEYHFLKKMENPSDTTGFSEGTEYFRLTSSKDEHQTSDKAPIQIIAVENGTFNNTSVSKAERLQSPISSNDKNHNSLDFKGKAFQSSLGDKQRTSTHSNEEQKSIVRKHIKSLKRGKESSLRLKSFLSPHKVKADGMTSRVSIEPRGTPGGKLVSKSSNASESFSHEESDGSSEAVRESRGSERSFTCKFGSCSYKTNLYKDFQRHYRTHTGEKPFKCSICGRTFNRSDKLKTHMRWHYGQKPFQCKLCDYASIESGSLKKHMRTHTDERPFQCQICSYASRNSSQLIVHLRTHTGDSPFHCNVCSAQFKINSDLKRHMRVHTGEKPFKCDKCDYRSSNKGNLKSHNRINHSTENEKKCPHCIFASSSLKILREHKKTHDAARIIKCTICQYTCNNATALRSHMTVHNSDKPYSCSACKYSCKQSGNLKKHMQNVHGHGENRVKIFMDSSASKKAYTTVSSAKQVKMIESKAAGQRRKRSANCRKMYMCNKCDCGFVRQDSLRCHLNHHRQKVEKDEQLLGDKRLEKRLISRTELSNSSSQRQATKPPPPAKRQGLDHIVAAASQLYQEQYMRNNGGETQSQSGDDIPSSLHTQESPDIVSYHGKKTVNQQTNSTCELRQGHETQEHASHCKKHHNQHHNADRHNQSDQSNTQHGTVPWEHSCYTLSSSKSRKHQIPPFNSSHQTAKTSKPTSDLPLVPSENIVHYESSDSSSQQGLMDRDNGSAYSGTVLVRNAGHTNTNTIASSQADIIVMTDAKHLLNTGSATEPVAIIPAQPQSSDVHFVLQHQMIAPSPQALPVSSFVNSQQPALVMAHESIEIGNSDSQTQTVTLQVLPQVATINQAGSQVATFAQDLTGQLSLQATPMQATHGTPIQISFPAGTQLIPQGSTLIAQPHVMFQLAGGTSQLNQNGQEVITIAADQPNSVTNSTLVNQTPQIVIGNIHSYGQTQNQMFTLPIDMQPLNCVQKRDVQVDAVEVSESFQVSSST